MIITLRTVRSRYFVFANLFCCYGKTSVFWILIDPRFWERFISLLNSTDTIITVKSSEIFKKSLRQTPTLRYTTMPVTNDTCSKQNFSNSLQYCKRNDGETSQNESSPSSDNTYGEGNNSNNSYMSIDNRTCPRFNYDLRRSPSSGHVYSRVEDISPTVPRSMTNNTAKGRTYFVWKHFVIHLHLRYS